MSVYKETPPQPSTKRGKLKYRIWKTLEKFRKPEIKFAVKVGVGAVLLALPAFTEKWRYEYTHWRGEWALLSYFVVIANSVGATTSTGVWRFTTFDVFIDIRILGTSLGAIAAIALYIYFVNKAN
jgi:Fusaric acid resistance protein-like